MFDIFADLPCHQNYPTTFLKLYFLWNVRNLECKCMHTSSCRNTLLLCQISIATWTGSDIFFKFVIAGFSEFPASLTLLLVEYELRAMFRCGYQLSVILNWLVNGLPSGGFPGAEEVVANENGTRVSTLTIPAIQENNRTVVVCLAGFTEGAVDREETPPVNLTLMTGYLTYVLNIE